VAEVIERLGRVAVAVFLASACSRDPEPGTPEAAAEGERLMRQMSDALASARTLQFATTEVLEGVRDTGEKRAFHLSRKVTVRRPNRLFLELHGSGATNLEAAVYYDGANVSLESDARRVWAQTEAPGTLDEMLDDVAQRFSLPLPFADVVYSSPYDALLGTSAEGGFVGRESVEGVECTALAYEDDFVEVRIWIPTSGPPLPRRLRILYKQMPGQPISELTFTSWSVGVDVDDETFTFSPDPDFSRIAVEEFISGAGAS
jgi:hypothetical protein